MILPDVVWHVFSAGSGGYTKVRRGGGEEPGGIGRGEGMHSHAIMPQSFSTEDLKEKKYVWILHKCQSHCKLDLTFSALVPTGCTIIPPKKINILKRRK